MLHFLLMPDCTSGTDSFENVACFSCGRNLTKITSEFNDWKTKNFLSSTKCIAYFWAMKNKISSKFHWKVKRHSVHQHTKEIVLSNCIRKRRWPFTYPKFNKNISLNCRKTLINSILTGHLSTKNFVWNGWPRTFWYLHHHTE